MLDEVDVFLYELEVFAIFVRKLIYDGNNVPLLLGDLVQRQ